MGCRRVPNTGYLERRRSLGLPESDRRWERRGMVRHRGYRDLLLHGVVDEPVEGTGEHYVYSRGIDFLTGSARQEQPWCLFLSTVGPHDPYVVPREYRRLYDARALTPPSSFHDDLAHRPAIYRRMQSVWDQMRWSDFAEATACYYAFCSLIDDQVGRVLRVLEETGQSENTLVLFLSDHGDYMGAHRLMLKGVPAFEEAYRVPLILKGPGVRPGQEAPGIVSLLDVAPTLMELMLGEGFSCHGPFAASAVGGRRLRLGFTSLRRDAGTADGLHSEGPSGVGGTSTSSTPSMKTRSTTWSGTHTSCTTWPGAAGRCAGRWPRACGRSLEVPETTIFTSRSTGASAGLRWGRNRGRRRGRTPQPPGNGD